MDDVAQESEASIRRRRQRRRRRAAITLTLVGLTMLGTFAYAAAYFQGWVGESAPKPAASAACRVVNPAKALTPNAVTINVYNATNRDGLAASVAKSLRTQGFRVAKVANDPLGKRIAGVGEVRHGKTGAPGATLAVTRLPGAKVVPDKRTDNTVDLVLGETFTALAPIATGAPGKETRSNSSPTDSC